MTDTGKQFSKASQTLIEAITSDTRPVGHPRLYDPDDYYADIIHRLTLGESLPMICKGSDMPSLRTVTKWMSGDDEFAEKVSQAKDLGIATLMDACFEIARGTAPLSTGSIERDKLLTSVIKWIVEKREGRSLREYHANRITITLENDDLAFARPGRINGFNDHEQRFSIEDSDFE